MNVNNGIMNSIPFETQQLKQVDIYKKVFGRYKHDKYLQGWKRAYVKRIFKDMYLKKDGALLDVGTGSGFISIAASKEGMFSVGVDISPESIRLCKKFAKIELGRNAIKKTKFVVADAEKSFPFSSNSFDRIVSIALLEHIPNDEKTISEIVRVLKKKA